MRKTFRIAAAAALTVGGVIAGTQAAFAESDAQISQLNTPGNHGYYSGYLGWLDAYSLYQSGNVCDFSADGHGPYIHIFGHTADGGTQFAWQHDTLGSGGCGSVNGGSNEFRPGHVVYSVNVWACNGGTFYGYGVEGGCYARRYYNPYVYPGQGSESLGTTTGAVY